MASIPGIQDERRSSGETDELENRLDDAVAESFPASDPVSLSMPHRREELNLHSGPSTTTMWLVGGGLLAVIALIALRR